MCFLFALKLVGGVSNPDLAKFAFVVEQFIASLTFSVSSVFSEEICDLETKILVQTNININGQLNLSNTISKK